MCNFQNKTKDTVHIGLLQNALKHDLILKRVYKTIQFKQSSQLNTNFRTDLDNDFKKGFFESIINSVFGKNIQGNK